MTTLTLISPKLTLTWYLHEDELAVLEIFIFMDLFYEKPDNPASRDHSRDVARNVCNVCGEE